MKLPNKGEIGSLNDSDLVVELASTRGRKLSSLWISVDFGTVLDINTNSNNPIIGIRAYGAITEKVTEFGMKEMDAIRNEKIYLIKVKIQLKKILYNIWIKTYNKKENGKLSKV